MKPRPPSEQLCEVLKTRIREVYRGKKVEYSKTEWVVLSDGRFKSIWNGDVHIFDLKLEGSSARCYIWEGADSQLFERFELLEKGKFREPEEAVKIHLSNHLGRNWNNGG